MGETRNDGISRERSEERRREEKKKRKRTGRRI